MAPLQTRSRWKLARLKLPAAVAPFLLLNAALGLLVPVMAPIKRGSSECFWQVACFVQVRPCCDNESGGSTYPRKEGWCIYYVQGFHDQWIYRVPEEEVLDDLPAALAQLQRFPDDSIPARKIARDAYTAWKSNGTEGDPDPRDFLATLEAADDAWRRAKGLECYGYHQDLRRDFDERWARAKRYWLTVAFEAAFLNGLLGFAAYAILRKRSPLRIAVLWGLLPLLFFAPYFLGYATWTFISRGPSGGVLYPWLITPFNFMGNFHAPWDLKILEALPPLLEPVGQPGGPWLSISGTGAPGPTGVVGLGILLGLIAFVLAKARATHPASTNSSN